MHGVLAGTDRLLASVTHILSNKSEKIRHNFILIVHTITQVAAGWRPLT